MKWEEKVISPIDPAQLPGFEAWLDIGSDERGSNSQNLPGRPDFHFVGYQREDGSELYLPQDIEVRSVADGLLCYRSGHSNMAELDLSLESGLSVIVFGLEPNREFMDYEGRRVETEQPIGKLVIAPGSNEQMYLKLNLFNSLSAVVGHPNQHLQDNRNVDPRLYLEDKVVQASDEFVESAQEIMHQRPQNPYSV